MTQSSAGTADLSADYRSLSGPLLSDQTLQSALRLVRMVRIDDDVTVRELARRILDPYADRES